MSIRGGILAAAVLIAAYLSNAPGAAAQGVSFSTASWPDVHGPFSWADHIMNSSAISRSGGIYALRKKTLELYSPAFEIVSDDASAIEMRGIDTGFFSYAIGSHMYEDAARLLFADRLFFPSDTLDYLRGLVAYDIHDFSRAADSFALIPESSPYYSQASSFMEVWSSTPGIPGYRKKSPVLAAAMSAVIPGSGKIYAGDLRSGISTLLIVGALGGMVAESWSRYGIKDWRTITLSSVFGLFYIGNIYGSAVSVSVIKNTYADAQKATLLFNLHVPLHQF